MKKIFSTALLFLNFLIFQNQANATALFYTDATYPITATGKEVKDLNQLKKGQSSTTNVLFLVEVGDAGIDTAAKNGRINKISYIDVNELNVLFLFRKLTVTVYGE